jgi:hypothetical protein
MKLLLLLFLSCFFCHDTYARVDNRKYADWGAYPYNMIVMVNFSGTGQYVAPDLVLTNLHVVDQVCYDANVDYINERGCDLLDSLEREFQGDVIAVGRPYSVMSGKALADDGRGPATDWALIRVRDPRFFRYDYFNVMPQAVAGRVVNAGFGAMRIITDAELRVIRKKFVRLMRQKRALNNDDDVILKHFSFEKFISELDEAVTYDDEDGRAMAPLFQDGDKLKFSRCEIENTAGGYLLHRCMGAHGNSGGAFWTGENDLHGILVSGNDSLYKKTMKIGYGVDSKSFYDTVMKETVLYEDFDSKELE